MANEHFELFISDLEFDFILLHMSLIEAIKKDDYTKVVELVNSLNDHQFETKAYTFALALLSFDDVSFFNDSFLYAIENLKDFTTNIAGNRLKAYLLYLEYKDDKNYEISKKFVNELRNIANLNTVPTKIISNFVIRNYRYGFNDLNDEVKTILE